MEKKKTVQKTEIKSGSFIAAIRIRGKMRVDTQVTDTLNMLRLYNNNYCIVLPNNELFLGMLRRTKDYITWGEIDDETFKTLVEKRGEEFKGRETDANGKIQHKNFISVNNKKIKKYFRLSPPRKGFERKGVKTTYQNGGALGYRGEKIKELIMRMI